MRGVHEPGSYMFQQGTKVPSFLHEDSPFVTESPRTDLLAFLRTCKKRWTFTPRSGGTPHPKPNAGLCLLQGFRSGCHFWRQRSLESPYGAVNGGKKANSSLIWLYICGDGYEIHVAPPQEYPPPPGGTHTHTQIPILQERPNLKSGPFGLEGHDNPKGPDCFWGLNTGWFWVGFSIGGSGVGIGGVMTFREHRIFSAVFRRPVQLTRFRCSEILRASEPANPLVQLGFLGCFWLVVRCFFGEMVGRKSMKQDLVVLRYLRLLGF